MSERLRGEFPDGRVPPTTPVRPLGDVSITHLPLDMTDYWPEGS